MPTPHIRQQYSIDKSIIFQKNTPKTCICSRKSLTSDAALLCNSSFFMTELHNNSPEIISINAVHMQVTRIYY